MNRITILKNIDRMLGPTAARIAEIIFPLRKPDVKIPERLLIIRPGGIGDAVLLVPAIRAVKDRLPFSCIHVLAEKRNSEVFFLTRDVDQVFRYANVADILVLLRNHYDAVIDTEQWHRSSAVLARMTRSPVVVGFDTNDRSRLFTRKIPYSQSDHEIDSFTHVIESVAGVVKVDTEAPFLIPSGENEHAAETILGPVSGKKTIAIFPGGSVVERQWGSDRFHLVAKHLSGLGYGIVVVGGMMDGRQGEEILGRIIDGINLCGKLSLPETAAVLRKSSLLITGDSGIMHVGYGVGAKVLALFGPGREKKWAPRGKNCVVINKKLDCSPCTSFGYTPACRTAAECMRAITVDDVLEKALELLKRN